MRLIANSLLLFLFLGINHVLLGQTVIKGQVIDEQEGVSLENATVILVQERDSILRDFTRTDENGKFLMSIADVDDFIVIISYPKYGDFFETINSGQSKDLGLIKMQTSAHLIEEVLVTGRIPVVIKGDTIEYDAGSFTVEKNAKVEDLLKVLPGMTVDASGKITAQGKVVEKVLVDGEEFFGTDPTLVTRNIRSDMVDKVQVYEKKSEQTERTGVDDGERIQTINVQLKEEARNGLFGKASAGMGTDDYYIGQVLLNRFKGSRKIGAFVLGSNNGKTELTAEENSQMTGEGGGMMMFGGPEGGYGGSGIPKAFSTGLNYNDKWSGDKNKINMSYVFDRVRREGTNEQQEQNNLQDRTLFNTQNSIFDNDQKKHNFNLKYDLKIDSLTSLTIDGGVDRSNSWNHSTDSSSMSELSKGLLNKQFRNMNNKSEFNSFNLNAYFTRRFIKEGRSASISFNLSDSKTDAVQFLNNELLYFDDQGEGTTTYTDQRKDNLNKYNNTAFSLAYTEPLWKKLVMSMSYSFANQSDKSSTLSYDKNADGEYNEFNTLYSSDFDYDRFTNSYNLAFTYNNDKFNINVTNLLRDDRLKQMNRFTDEKLQRDFLTYNPMFSVRYNLNKTSSIGIQYNGNNNLPSLNQIQPLRNNEDELNIYLGNEDLKPEFNNSISLNFGKWNAFKGSFLYLGGNVSNIRSPFVMNLVTDAQGRNTYKWENLSGKSNNSIVIYGGGGFKVHRKWGVDLRLSPSINFNNSYNYVNDELNNSKNTSYALTAALQRNMTKGLDFNFSVSPSFVRQTTDIQPEFDNNGFVLNSSNSFKYYLPKTFQVFVDVNYIYEAPTSTFASKFQRVMINPGISKKFMKDETIEVSFIVNDLLNENVGFRRSQNGNRFVQSQFDTIRRYYMLKVSWDINKMFTVQ